MRCRLCKSSAVHSRLCKDHFVSRFEERVRATIRERRLLSREERVAVACSGGKDSMVLLHLLHASGYKVTALAIDEGIAGYRDSSLGHLKSFCKKEKILLKIIGFSGEYGQSLDNILKKNPGAHPCTVCGTFRRQLLNKHAHSFDALATGHNADDEAQTVLMNLCRANVDLFPRGGPRTTSRGEGARKAELSGAPGTQSVPRGFVKRVKPLYFCTEKEVMLYAVLKGLNPLFEECPYANQAYRDEVRSALNEYERKRPGAKERVLRHYLDVKARMRLQESVTVACGSCGEPSESGVCKACRLKKAVIG